MRRLQSVVLVPVAIAYDVPLEEDTLLAELSGAPKR